HREHGEPERLSASPSRRGHSGLGIAALLEAPRGKAAGIVAAARIIGPAEAVGPNVDMDKVAVWIQPDSHSARIQRGSKVADLFLTDAIHHDIGRRAMEVEARHLALIPESRDDLEAATFEMVLDRREDLVKVWFDGLFSVGSAAAEQMVQAPERVLVEGAVGIVDIDPDFFPRVGAVDEQVSRRSLEGLLTQLRFFHEMTNKSAVSAPTLFPLDVRLRRFRLDVLGFDGGGAGGWGSGLVARRW